MEIEKVATSTIDALGRTQPLALALVVVNVLFLVGGGYILHDLGSAIRTERAEQQKFIRDIMQNCLAPRPGEQQS